MTTNEMPTRERVERSVAEAIASSLDIDPSEVELTASLADELGVESLDVLEFTFTLEKEFNIQMPRQEILDRAAEHFGEESLVKDDLVTPLGLELMRGSMPEVDPEKICPGLTPDDVVRLISAASFVRIIRRLLEAKNGIPRECPDCGGTLEEIPGAPELACESCETTVFLPSGDEVLLRDMIALGDSLEQTG